MTDTDNSTPAPVLSRRPKKRLLFASACIVAVIILGLIAIFAGGKLHVGQKVYAKAAGHNIYKKDMDTIQLAAGEKTKITDHQAAMVLADKYLLEAMAKQQGVQVTQADITAAYGQSIGLQRTIDPYGYQNLVNQLYLTKLDTHNQGIYAGKLLIANFSRYIPYQSALLPKQKAADPKLGDPAAINQDKQYAQTFITDLYNQIKAKKITFDQAIQIEHSDPVVGESVYPTQQHSGPFNGPLSQIPQLNAQSIRGKVTGMKPGQLSQPFVMRTSNSSTDRKSTAETSFLVVQMDKVSGGSDMTFQQELAKAKKEFGYKVNV